MILHNRTERVNELYQMLLKHNHNKLALKTQDVAEFLGVSQARASKILKNTPYLIGRTHMYLVQDVAEAIYESMYVSTDIECDCDIRKVG